MDYKKEKLLFATVQRENILPITSKCNLSCIFCSHKNNPPEIKTLSLGNLKFALIKDLIEFIDPQKPLIIGESATRIIEGEAFLHPEINKILSYLYSKWPEINLKITTNGTHIGDEELVLLKRFENLELNISVNAPGPEERLYLMNDKNAENVFELLEKLKENNILFNASIVSMHHITGFNFINRTLKKLELYKPDSLRIFLPGFSKYASDNLTFKNDIYKELDNFINIVSQKYSYPIILEPQLIDNLDAEIKGIIKNSAADNAGLKKDDIIININNDIAESRVDAFYKIKESKNPTLTVKRDDKIIDLKILKEENKKPGLIMAYDISPFTKEKFVGYLKQSKKINTVIITSEFAYPMLKYIVDNNIEDDYNIELIKVKNRFFGASIMSAGLLVNRDISSALEKNNFPFKRIIMPEIIYDYYGYDLTLESYTELEKKFNSEIILL